MLPLLFAPVCGSLSFGPLPPPFASPSLSLSLPALLSLVIWTFSEVTQSSFLSPDLSEPPRFVSLDVHENHLCAFICMHVCLHMHMCVCVCVRGWGVGVGAVPPRFPSLAPVSVSPPLPSKTPPAEPSRSESRKTFPPDVVPELNSVKTFSNRSDPFNTKQFLKKV